MSHFRNHFFILHSTAVSMKVSQQADSSLFRADWQSVVQQFDYAFQPIVNIHTGICLGFEALLRNWGTSRFNSINQIFDAAHYEDKLSLLDHILREKAIRKFKSIPFHKGLILFVNLDNRIFAQPALFEDTFSKLLAQEDLHPSHICLEISERHQIPAATDFYNYHRHSPLKIALDNFGSGYSGMWLLYNMEPHFIKIDRLFIEGIASDARKKLFVTKVVGLAHMLGIRVIAERVETSSEFQVCKEIGCDYLQGYFIQAPTGKTSELALRYAKIEKLAQNDRRKNSQDLWRLDKKIEKIKPLILDVQSPREKALDKIFNYFQLNSKVSFLPVVDGNHEPLGLIREKDLKEFVYSLYGRDLLMNKYSKKHVQDFITPCPISEISTTVEDLIEIFSVDVESEGILLTRHGKYIGFLSTQSLLHILNEKNIAMARDQNPLTRIAGNNLISDYIARRLQENGSKCSLIYFDFDNFKPFNDTYGFRLGDRAIMMFADILKEISLSHDNQLFIGHIGGDDFFCGFPEGGNRKNLTLFLRDIMSRFSNDAASLYSKADRERGTWRPDPGKELSNVSPS